MKKIIVIAGLLVSGIAAFCQQEENGIVYVKHPYIDAINTSAKSYEAKDVTTLKTLYSDTATYWISGRKKVFPWQRPLKTG